MEVTSGNTSEFSLPGVKLLQERTQQGGIKYVKN